MRHPAAAANSSAAALSSVAVLALVALAAGPAFADTAPAPARAAPAAPPEGAPPNMESVQLVILMRAPTWKKLPDAEAEALQVAHLAHLTKMGETGKAVVCGPFDNQQDPTFRGACIYTVASPQEARELASQDPTVKAGQLRVEVVTWWFEKGYMTFPKASAAPAAPRHGDRSTGAK